MPMALPGVASGCVLAIRQELVMPTDFYVYPNDVLPLTDGI